MVKQILAFLVGLIVEGSLEGDGLYLVLGKVYFLDTFGYQVERLELAVGLHLAASHVLQYQFGLILQQVVAPQVVAILERGLVIQRVALRTQNGIAQMTGIHREAYDAVFAIVEVEHQRLLGLSLGSIFLVSLLIILLGILFLVVLLGLSSLCLLGFFLSLVQESFLLLRHLETLIGIQVEEHQIHILLRTP